MKVLVVNVGSTSLKFRLFEMPDEAVLAEGSIERVGALVSPVVYRTRDGPTREAEIECPDQGTAIRHALRLMRSPGGVLPDLADLAAVGFKPVHAKGISDAVFVDDEVIAAMEEYRLLAPAHNPPYVAAFRWFRDTLPATPLVGVFETAFHRTIPDYASTYGIPEAWRKKHAIRRYGFHGASHRYVSTRVPELLGRTTEELRIVSCHLGGSSSVCAIRGGVSLDTSMGFSPQSGLPSATRNGDLDPFIVLYVMAKEGWNPKQVGDVLTREGGLKGISGLGGDVRDLTAAAHGGDARAELALNVLAYETRKYIGAYAAVLGGIDVLAFTGGIGEHSAAMRTRICRGLEFLGVDLDSARNEGGGTDAVISPDGSRVIVAVIRANEELVVARETMRLLAGRNGGATRPGGESPAGRSPGVPAPGVTIRPQDGPDAARQLGGESSDRQRRGRARRRFVPRSGS